MKYVNYFGDDRLIHKLIYTRNSYSECIYCGNRADTREHIPSKAFLIKPYPDNLSTVPACKKCNNSFSNDEFFVSIFIEVLKYHFFGKEYTIPDESINRFNKNKVLVDQIITAIKCNDLVKFEDKLLRILQKLAIGHAVYELSEGYYKTDKPITAFSVGYSFLNNMTNNEVEDFILPFNISFEPLPEMGSRVYERIMLVEAILSPMIESQENICANLLLLDWVDVQDSKYSYTGYKFGDEIIIKMVINDFVYSNVILKL